MNGSGTGLAPEPAQGASPKGRSPLAHLLHALNQPLTGLQCSLELALAGPRRPEQYARALREGLDLTARMRVLVEAIRELADLEQEEMGGSATVRLDALLRDTVEELRPVAECRSLRLSANCEAALPLQIDRRFLVPLMFRFLECALSLAAEGSDLLITATTEQNRAVLAVSWNDGPAPEYSPFSRAELGLIIAQAGWKQAGAQWERKQLGGRQTCTVRWPLAASPANSLTPEGEDLP